MLKLFGQSECRYSRLAGGLALSAALLISGPSNTQAQSLKPLCIGVAAFEPTKRSRSCCQGRTKGRCLRWEQMFPELKQRSTPVVRSSNPPTPFMRVEKPAMNFDPKAPRSANAAKDAVIQMGVDKLLKLITIRPKTFKSGAKPSRRKPNFFERVQRDYDRIFKPKPIGGNATLTPQLDVGVDLSEASISSMKAGIKIEF